MTKAPIRTCIACGKAGTKRELVRIVRAPSGVVELDTSGKAAGRGAYVCLDAACFERVVRGRMLASRLRTAVEPGDYERLEESFRDLLVQEAGCEGQGE